MRTKDVVVGLLVLIVVASAIYFSSTPRNSSDNGSAPDADTAAEIANSTQIAEAGRLGASEQSDAQTNTRPLTLLDRYAQSTDLFALVAELRADSDAGDANAARFIAMAYDECYLVAAENPKVVDMYRRSLDSFSEPERSIYRSHRMKAEQRCAGFATIGGIKPSEVNDTDEKASAMNDLTAQAQQLAEAVGTRRRDGDATHSLSDSEIQVAQKIALSGNPEAIANLAYSQDDRYLGKNVQQMSSPEDPANLSAWLLVACDMGRDCASNGYIMRQQCLSIGLCFNGDYREYLRRRRLSPDKYELVLAREREILHAINSGNVSHLFP